MGILGAQCQRERFTYGIVYAESVFIGLHEGKRSNAFLGVLRRKSGSSAASSGTVTRLTTDAASSARRVCTCVISAKYKRESSSMIR